MISDIILAWLLVGLIIMFGVGFSTAYFIWGVSAATYLRQLRKKVIDEAQFDSAVLRCRLDAKQIAARIIPVGSDWAHINPDTFRVSRCVLSYGFNGGDRALRRVNIVIAGVRPGVKIPRIVGKLQDHFMELGFYRDEINVVCEAVK